MGWSAGIVVLAGVFFDRFDPARTRPRKSRHKKKKKEQKPDTAGVATAPSRSWADLPAVKPGFGPTRMLRAELRLMLKGRHWLWYLVGAGLIAAQSAVPFEYARAYTIPAALIWPLAVWSAMGTREARFNTRDLLVSSPYPISRQLPAVWMAGIVVALLMCGGMLVRATIAGETGYLVSLLAGCLFVPTLALAMGTLSGSKKLFEVVYLVVWYIGPVNGLGVLDFAGTSDATVSGANSLTYVVISLILVAGAITGRRTRIVSGTT